MKEFRVEISQNGWEYIGYAYIKCHKIKQIDKDAVKADDIEIRFDEVIGEISEVIK